VNRQQVIDLNDLEQKHSAKIAQMSAAISGEAGCALWTTQMRSAIRGGKPLGSPRIKESFESDYQS